MFYFDRTYILVLIGIFISSIAQANIQRKFDKYKKIKTQKSITGFDAARYILSTNSYNDISIKKVRGSLSDYFNPVNKEIALSETSMLYLLQLQLMSAVTLSNIKKVIFL